MVQDGAGQQPQEVACRTNARQRSCLSGIAAEYVRRMLARVSQPQVSLAQRLVLLLGFSLCPKRTVFKTGGPCLAGVRQKRRYDKSAARFQVSVDCRQGRAIFLRF